MKIIADANIWYYLGQCNELYESIKEEPITPIYLNLLELSKSKSVIYKEKESRLAVQMLFKFQKNLILYPPSIYIPKLNQKQTCQPSKIVQDNVLHLLKFTSDFAKGNSIQDKSKFREEIDKVKNSILIRGSDFVNAEAEKIKLQIEDKNSYKNKNTDEVIASFINGCIKKATNNSCQLGTDFNLNQIELLIKTLSLFFKNLVTSHQKFQANDWFDFVILGYVQPGDKYWTYDNKWIQLIKNACCSHYLYESEPLKNIMKSNELSKSD